MPGTSSAPRKTDRAELFSCRRILALPSAFVLDSISCLYRSSPRQIERLRERSGSDALTEIRECGSQHSPSKKFTKKGGFCEKIFALVGVKSIDDRILSRICESGTGPVFTPKEFLIWGSVSG